MKARLLQKERIRLGDKRFVEIVVWQVPNPVPGSAHGFKYRMVLVVNEVSTLRYENEAGKGDHKHVGKREIPYEFASVSQLLADFMNDVSKWKE